MLSAIKGRCHPTINQSDWKNRMSQPPILWVRFFGWFVSGVGLAARGRTTEKSRAVTRHAATER